MRPAALLLNACLPTLTSPGSCGTADFPSPGLRAAGHSDPKRCRSVKLAGTLLLLQDTQIQNAADWEQLKADVGPPAGGEEGGAATADGANDDLWADFQNVAGVQEQKVGAAGKCNMSGAGSCQVSDRLQGQKLGIWGAGQCGDSSIPSFLKVCGRTCRTGRHMQGPKVGPSVAI